MTGVQTCALPICICGVTAIVSTAPAIEADEREVAYAVANVVAFGLFGMLTYPYLAHAVLPTSETIGLFLGTAVHDTSQVVGSALTYKQVYGDDVVLRVATVTKLTRNIFLAFVIPILTWMHVKSKSEQSGSGAVSFSLSKFVPGFVVGFLAMAVVRSFGDWTLTSNGAAFGVWDAARWAAITASVAPRRRPSVTSTAGTRPPPGLAFRPKTCGQEISRPEKLTMMKTRKVQMPTAACSSR